jgi:hypothetical protein
MSQATGPSSPVNTKKVADHRKLHFDSIDQLMAEVDRLVEAERAGRLKHLGNWTLGQTLGHVACWAEYSYTGAPLKVPFFIKWIVRLRKKRFLYGPMTPGVRIPRVPGGTLATDVVPLDEAVERIRGVMQRLKSEAPTALNPLFGSLTHDEWIALTSRHAELHLGFHVPA